MATRPPSNAPPEQKPRTPRRPRIKRGPRITYRIASSIPPADRAQAEATLIEWLRSLPER